MRYSVPLVATRRSLEECLPGVMGFEGLKINDWGSGGLMKVDMRFLCLVGRDYLVNRHHGYYLDIQVNKLETPFREVSESAPVIFHSRVPRCYIIHTLRESSHLVSKLKMVEIDLRGRRSFWLAPTGYFGSWYHYWIEIYSYLFLEFYNLLCAGSKCWDCRAKLKE